MVSTVSSPLRTYASIGLYQNNNTFQLAGNMRPLSLFLIRSHSRLVIYRTEHALRSDGLDKICISQFRTEMHILCMCSIPRSVYHNMKTKHKNLDRFNITTYVAN